MNPLRSAMPSPRPSVLWLVLPALLACTAQKPAGKPVAPPQDVMRPAKQARQILEGRLTYEEQQVIENQEVRTARRWVFAVAGERVHRTEGKDVWIQDELTELRLLESEGPRPPAPTAFQIRHPLGTRGEFRFRGAPEGAFGALTDPLESLYPLVHFWFRKKLHPGLTFSRAVPLTRRIQGQVLDTSRDVRYRLVEHAVSRHQNLAVIHGSYLNTKLGTLRTGSFDLECVGKAELELEFQLDTGVWTRIDAKEIIGWAGIAFDDTTLAPVNAGHRTITHLQLHLTGN